MGFFGLNWSRWRRRFRLLLNMGWRYSVFRVLHELKRRSGYWKRRDPITPPPVRLMTLDEWRNGPGKFFFSDRDTLDVTRRPTPELARKAHRICAGEVEFFHSVWYGPDKLRDWHVHPESGYRFDFGRHWSEFESLDAAAGDIKYVWERARFSHLLTVMRYDYHFGEDHADFVFREMEDFIGGNPVNAGVHYICSQEISLRLMNWFLLLNFYKHNPALTEARFECILQSIFRQIQHVERNINFSRIAVRNNHAITECTLLYVAALLFPSFPGASRWKKQGLKWLLQEVDYQIYADGTHLQYSTNYHRVVIQTLSYGLAVALANQERLPERFLDKMSAGIHFLFHLQNPETGWLPNYGANDGAWFFPLDDQPYRDYRPQLDAAYALVTGKNLYPHTYEDREWLGANRRNANYPATGDFTRHDGVMAFPDGGIYLYREGDTLTLLKCAAYRRNRPSHADGGHLDLWVGAKNVLFDGGSYKYNTNSDEIRYFFGTRSHNTVMLGDCDQMLKGPRFIWYDWTRQARCQVIREPDATVFVLDLEVFTQVKRHLFLHREVVKKHGRNEWVIRDMLSAKPEGMDLIQLWHCSCNDTGIKIQGDGAREEYCGWCSDFYGEKHAVKEIIFRTCGSRITTTIEVDSVL